LSYSNNFQSQPEHTNFWWGKLATAPLLDCYNQFLSTPVGHGGARAAEFVKQNLFTNLIKHPKFFSDTKSAIGIATLCTCYGF
jgi:hypothetical protein